MRENTVKMDDCSLFERARSSSADPAAAAASPGSLNKPPGIFKSFMVEPFTGTLGPSVSYWERLNSSGTEINVFRLDTSPTQSQEATIVSESWSMAPGSRPELKGSHTFSVVPSVDLKLYERQPRDATSGPLSPFDATEDGRVLRVGSKVYARTEGSALTFRPVNLAEHKMGYVQEIGCNGKFFAIAYRDKIPDPVEEEANDGGDLESELCEEQCAAGEDTSLANCGSQGADGEGLGKSNEKGDDDDDGEIIDDFGDLDRSIHEESALARWMSKNADADQRGQDVDKSSIFSFDEFSDAAAFNSAYESWSEGSTAAMTDEIGEQNMLQDLETPGENHASDDLSSNKCDVGKSAYDSHNLSESGSSSLSVSSSQKSIRNDLMLDEFQSLPTAMRAAIVDQYIHRPPPIGNSDGSSTDQSSEFECDSESDLDDEPRGDREKQLNDLLRNGQRVDSNGTPCEIKVFRIPTESDEEAPCVFRFSQRSATPLYASPPVFHQSHDLLVWPLGANEILFANFTNKTYFIRRVVTTYRKSHQISVTCRFSPCGHYLHIASLDGIVPSESKDSGTKHLALCLHIFTYRLSHRKLARSPPRLVYRTSVNLKSEVDKLAIASLMHGYTLTWTASHVYVAEGGRKLRVYRVPLYRDVEEKEKTADAPKAVFTNTGDVDLLEATERRKVYFLPGTSVLSKRKSRTNESSEYVAHVILGSRNPSRWPDVRGTEQGVEAAPPQGAHLTMDQFGTWESAEACGKGIEMIKRVESWREGCWVDKTEKLV
ncbi:hypothetical protein GGR50DRAFT_436334 [Xylaria sp. CBS 124048]|nr:hypothetical protein GGR50DRAFT_436334 [Xylaria sp. CBS 124048]